MVPLVAHEKEGMVAWKFAPEVRRQLFPRQVAREKAAQVTDGDYVDFVRRFRQSELVSMVAAVAPRYSFNQSDYATNTLVTPWGLADVARVSLAFGSERNRLSPTKTDLMHCLAMHNQLGHPGLEGHEPDVAGLILQVAFYQFPYQRHIAPLWGRSIALFDQTEVDPAKLKVLRGDWQTELLGCSLPEYIGVTQLMMAAARPNSGRFDPSWIEHEHLKALTDVFDPAVTRHVMQKHLVAPASSFRSRDTQRPGPGRRFTFNHLMSTPVVSGLGPDLLMPVPDFILWKPTPGGLFYDGIAKWDETFAVDLGHVFEAYVGRQLHLITGAQVFPAVLYRQGKDTKESIDWIVVFPHLVLLVEVKARRSNEALRSGHPEGAARALQQAFNKANKQLEATHELIKARAPEFDHIPADRPIAGITVTIEDFHVANSALHLPMYSRSSKLPTLVVAVDELEGIVCLGAATEDFLLEQLSKAPGMYANLRPALSKHQVPRNPILEAGIAASPIYRVKDDG